MSLLPAESPWSVHIYAKISELKLFLILVWLRLGLYLFNGLASRILIIFLIFL